VAWNNVGIGQYSLTAVAIDNDGNRTISNAVIVNVVANAAPTVSITAPANNAVFQTPGTVILTATAADSDGTISKVEFYRNTTLINTDTSAPYSYTDLNVVAGNYTYTAKAYDNIGSVTTSAAVNVTVTEAVGAAPIYFIYTDQLNTPRVITNAQGSTVWKWDNVDPFGNNAPNENPSGLGNFTCNLRFPGQYFDKETNTHYNYYRDYDPAIGRYVESDPIGLEGGVNTYVYVANSPTMYADPTGLDRWGDTSANYRYSPTAGGPVDQSTSVALTCYSICVGGNKPGPGVTVTAGQEDGHSPGSAHETGQACDIGKNSNPGLDRSKARQCYQQCFNQSRSYAQEESNHYHF
jgi:RHS repeat-associated protein